MHELSDYLSASSYLRKLDEQLDGSASANSHAEQLALLCESIKIANAEDAETLLLYSKAKFDYHWALALFNSELDQANLGRWRSVFADATIDLALRYAWQSIIEKHKGLSRLSDLDGRVDGLFIYALGKLGGQDLNFSSDVDLIAFFDPELLPVPDALGKSYIAHQVLQKLTQCLSQNGASDFVWRVDWRLRPNASATTLAMSTSVALDYYFYRASPWHRLALLKARVVAGDIKLGQQFMSELTPFVWRQNLDYRALDELAEIKQRINAEHPGLRVQRQWVQAISDEVAGFNLKLGTGGIREVEFVVNALQLLWGGRDPSLRTTHTMDGLAALGAGEYLDSQVCQQLAQAYSFFRHLENAVQLRENQHDHLLPQAEQLQEAVLLIAGFSSWKEMSQELNTHRKVVSRVFSKLFAEQNDDQTEQIKWPESLSVAAQDVVDAWDAGYLVYGVSQDVRIRLQPLTRALANYLTSVDSKELSEVIMTLHRFFQSLPVGEQYFRLLAGSPQLLDNIVAPLLHSPAMTTLLQQSPHIIDCFVQAHWQWGQEFETDAVLKANSYEHSLERLRRFVNEYLYQLYLAFLQARLSPADFQQALTSLAEQTLELSLTAVAKGMQLESIPVAVIGMGKLGLSCMAPMSDLDLIFVFDEQTTDIQTATRFVSRLQTAISTPMREGIVYELDTRLRPSGRSGVPTVSLASFAKHHEHRAHTWEHIALMPSRVVAGDFNLQDKIEAVKTTLLETKRDSSQSLNDMLKMYKRIEEHRITTTLSSVFNTKLRAGGLMQAEYLAACLVLARNNGAPLGTINFAQLLKDTLKENELELPTVIQRWRTLQLWERLLGLTDKPLDELPLSYQKTLLEQLGLQSLAELEQQQADNEKIVLAIAADFFRESQLLEGNGADQTSQLDEWQETGVIWTDKEPSARQ